MQWNLREIFEASRTCKGFSLSVQCAETGEDSWMVFAIEVPQAAVDANSIDMVLDNHSHHVIAENVEDGPAARMIAEHYANEWRKARRRMADPSKPCDCKEIDIGLKLELVPPLG